jgi:hypothetical protein
MYEVLRRCRGYRAAFIGWNPEKVVDLGELAETWTEELSAGGSLPGLVLSDDALAQPRQVRPRTAPPPTYAVLRIGRRR